MPLADLNAVHIIAVQDNGEIITRTVHVALENATILGATTDDKTAERLIQNLRSKGPSRARLLAAVAQAKRRAREEIDKRLGTDIGKDLLE